MKGRFGVRLRVEDIVGLTRTGCAGVENTYRYLINIGCKCIDGGGEGSDTNGFI